MKYNPQKIEGKWRTKRGKPKTYSVKDNSPKEKSYILFEFPYPSGEGLHVGHLRPYVAMDIIARKRRADGFNVLFPIGWDAFGLPAETYAIKTGIHPHVQTRKNINTYRRQMKLVGLSLNWEREINTTDPAYYRWTQWIFLKLFEAGLAYKAKAMINWCPSCKIGLANEEVVGGKCERCGTKVIEKEKEQWMLKITAYAEKLLAGLRKVDFLPEIKTQQENWIGKSEGALIKFKLRGIAGQSDDKHSVELFTTRPDTIFGVTFVAISPELAQKWIGIGWKADEKIKEAVRDMLDNRLDDREKGAEEKSGIDAGIRAINPANGEEVPVLIVNYVLADVGTGAIMGVPAHDERDKEFAQKFNLPIIEVISKEGLLINSGQFDGMNVVKAKEEIIQFVGGEKKTTYKLRDWVFSRQRYWGEPIPLIFCENCHKDATSHSERSEESHEIFRHAPQDDTLGARLNPGWVKVPEKDLPVKLPNIKDFKPREDGESPLASVEKWVAVKCPTCGEKARRETDVMPNWAGSSWYFLAYALGGKSYKTKGKKWWNKELLEAWMPVDWYNGGMEHTTLHLLYSRFWNEFLYDQGLVPTSEPYKKRTAHGLILGEGGIKMSKSKGNVVNPDAVVKEFGADALRVYEMFIGPFEQSTPWDPQGIVGVSRFLEKIWKIAHGEKLKKQDDKALEKPLHQTIKKVSEDIEKMAFNTAVSAMMIFINACEKADGVSKKTWRAFLQILAPFAPFIAHELWTILGEKKNLDLEPWPQWDSTLIVENEIDLILQVDGKTRDRVRSRLGLSEEEATKIATTTPNIKKWIEGRTIKRVVFVKDRLVNVCLE